MKVYAGMDIGGTKVALGVFGEDKTLLGKTKYPSDASLSAEEFFQQAAAQLRALLGRLALPEEDLRQLGQATEAFLMTQQERGFRTLDYYKSLLI